MGDIAQDKFVEWREGFVGVPNKFNETEISQGKW